MTMRWSRVHAAERGREYLDHVAGPFRIAEGYDEPARREGRPWTLFERQRAKGSFKTLADAKKAAQEAP